ncbi:MAG: DUF111 family protein [Thermoplasmata archaeon]|nr:DUF111 family protein [Thermoplasmata archaeon]
MHLVIDTRNGLAGDIMAAGLIGVGANSKKVIEAMEIAGNLMGPTKVTHSVNDCVHRLNVDIDNLPGHLHASQARNHLGKALDKTGITAPWSDIGRNVLEVLVEAEGHVHSRHPQLSKHFHGHEPVLHEASDIIIDIMGMAAGMMDLGIKKVQYLDYVNVGSGNVKFSHGTLEVPTPATRHVLEGHGIPWKRSDMGMEMTTPTGASILAGCGAVRILAEPGSSVTSLAGGTRQLPPITFMLLESNP